MKRKKWSELEEKTLLTKYSDLVTSGALAKLKTREKKFKPIAEHVNSVHHLRDPVKFPFKWSWRDVSIKVQNMRHQYLGVKQKIRVSDREFNWEDGENHWENFVLYKEVFGDIELEVEGNKRFGYVSGDVFGDDIFGLGFDELQNGEDDDDDGDDDYELGVGKGEREESDDSGLVRVRKKRKGVNGRMLGLVGAQMLELRDVMMRKTKRDFGKEMEMEEREMRMAKREVESRVRLEMEFEEERRRRMKVEERWEEEEMKWREKMVRMQIEHEKQMMQLHANACHNQMQILGVMARFFCQFFGSTSDGLGALGPQVLQHPIPGGLDDNGKPDANSPSEFL